MPIEMMERDLNGKLKVPAIPASALKGDNVVFDPEKNYFHDPGILSEGFISEEACDERGSNRYRRR